MAHFSFLLKSFVFTFIKKDRGEINEIKTLDDWQLLIINVIIEKKLYLVQLARSILYPYGRDQALLNGVWTCCHVDEHDD